MQEDRKLHVPAYYITQYLWMLYIIIPLLISLVIPYKTDSKGIVSLNEKFNSSKDPFVFAHLTDIHINRLTPASITSFQTTVTLLKHYQPDFILVSGDITDNYEPPSNPRYGDEIEENWMIYKREMSNISYIPIVEVAGNHDQFGVKGVLSHKNYIIDYSGTYNRNNTFSDDDYKVRSFKVGRSQTNVIAINPYQFPAGHPPLLFFMRFSKNILDSLTAELKKNPKSLVTSHYPVATMHSESSSEGLYFTDIIGSQKSVLAYLTGHTHPKKVDLYHQGKGNLEIIGPSNYYGSQFGLVTIDNDMVTWSTVNLNTPPKGVVSFPTPKSQLSPHSIFNDIENSEIRLIMFTNQTDLKIRFTVVKSDNSEDPYSDYLEYSKVLVDGKQVLYRYPLKKCILSSGNYNLTFSEDSIDPIEFFVGDVIVAGNEVMPTMYNARCMLFVTFPIFFLILFAITFVSPFGDPLTAPFETMEEWIETSKGDGSHWFFLCVLGFFLVRCRFQRTPEPLKIFVFISIVWAVGGPILLFETEDLTGYISVFGYFIGGKAITADFGTFLSYFYLFLVCMPMVILCSSLSVKQWSYKQDGDLVFALATLIGNAVIMIEFIWECVGKKYALSSIGFVGVPVVFGIMFVYYFFAKKDENGVRRTVVAVRNPNDPSLEYYLTSNQNVEI